MAKQHTAPPHGQPTIPPDRGVELLTRQIEKAKAILSARPISSAADSAWEAATRDYLEQAFGANTRKLQEVFPIWVGIGGNEYEAEKERAEQITESVAVLEALLEVLQARIEGVDLAKRLEQLEQNTKPSAPSSATSRKVFIVHGHDGETKQDAARFLESLKLDVTILHEKANLGRTLIEKFEAHADVGFAVILLTADDRGGVADIAYDKQRARARQNVIFELGYFIGRIGRAKVCALYESGVELPTDYHGVAFVPLDAGGAWKLDLANELHAAGYEIDFNLLKKKR